ncbi:uncharacterized protein [Littorina saxatilis]|uniref:uncharacterized protein isoform X1 n=1 Tax=Littorina saxatilis TaxID=31220 RepID=UPI0038B4AA1C
MSVQYEPVIDELSQSEDFPERPELYFMQASNRRGRKWPRAIGLVQIIVGFLIALLGALEVFIVPITENHTAPVQFNKHTCYGAGLFAGVLMVLTGSTAVRASLSKRKSTVFRFYNLTILTLLLYTAFTVFLIVAYSKGWTTEAAYPPNSRVYQVHMFVTIFVVLGLMFALTALVQYYDVVCCGEMNLWHNWLYCLCGICLGKVKGRIDDEDEDDDEDERVSSGIFIS